MMQQSTLDLTPPVDPPSPARARVVMREGKQIVNQIGFLRVAKQYAEPKIKYEHKLSLTLGNHIVLFADFQKLSLFFYRLRKDTGITQEDHHALLQDIYRTCIKDSSINNLSK